MSGMRWVPGVGFVWESGIQRQIKATHDTFNAQTRAWRLYADGTESGSSPLQAENTTDDLDVTSGDVQFHLRYSVQENGSGTASGAATDDWQLEFNIDALGWNPVTAASTGIIADTGATPSDTSATTNRSTNGISDGTGTFIASEVEAGNGEITDWQLTGDNFAEMLFCLKAVSADLSGGESINFRLLYNGSATASIDNDVTPNVTITKDSSYNITVPQADLDLSPTAPAVLQDARFSPPAGDLVLSTTVPSVNFPQTVAPTETSVGTAANAHNVAMPAVVNSGDLLLVGITFCFIGQDVVAGLQTPSGWTSITGAANSIGGGPGIRGDVFGKVADGTEGGTTVDFNTSDTGTSVAAAQAYRITDWDGSIANVEGASLIAAGGSATWDPPNLAPSWGSDKALWFVFAFGSDDDATASTYPTNYAYGVDTVSGGGTNNGCEVASARRELEATSENPGSGTWSELESPGAATVAVRAASGVNYNITVPQGDLTLSSEAPAVDESHFVIIPQGDLVLDAEAPVLAVSLARAPPQGDLTLSTEAPAVDVSYDITVPQGDLILSGTAPAPSVGTVIEVPEAQLHLRVPGTLPAVGFPGVNGYWFDNGAGVVQPNTEVSWALLVRRDGSNGKAIDPGWATAGSSRVTFERTFRANFILNPNTDSVVTRKDGADLSEFTLIVGSMNTVTHEVTMRLNHEILRLPSDFSQIVWPPDDPVFGGTFYHDFGLPVGGNVAGANVPLGKIAYVVRWDRFIDWNLAENYDLLYEDGYYKPIPDDGDIDGLGAAIDVFNKELPLAHVNDGKANNWTPSTDRLYYSSGPESTEGGITVTVAGPSPLLQVPAGQLQLDSVIGVVEVDATVNGDDNPGQANLVLEGFTPAVENSGDGADVTRDPPQGDLVLSSTVPSVDISYDITAPQADLTLSTTAPSVDVSYNITVPQGDLALSSEAPGVDESHFIEIPQGDLVLDAEAPVLAVSLARAPPQGDLTLSAEAPGVDVSYDITVPGGDLALSAETPSAALGFFIEPPQGDLTLSAEAPSIGASFDITVPAGDLVLSTTAPGVGGVIEVPQGNLVLSTVAPQVQPIALLNIQNSVEDTNSTTETLASYQIPNGLGRVLVVHTACENVDVTGVTFGSISLELLDQTTHGANHDAVFLLKEDAIPADLTQNITVTKDNAVDPVSITALTLVNADQTNPTGGAYVESSQSSSDPTDSSVTPSAAYSAILCFFSGGEDKAVEPSSTADPAMEELVDVTIDASLGSRAAFALALTRTTSAKTLGWDLTLGGTINRSLLRYVAWPTIDTLLHAPQPADLVLSTTAPTTVATIPQGDLTLSTTAPDVVVTVTDFVIPQANLVLSTTAPSVVNTNLSHYFVIPPRVLSLSGQEIELDGRIPRANLTLTGSAPVVGRGSVSIHMPDDPGAVLMLTTTAPILGGTIVVDGSRFDGIADALTLSAITGISDGQDGTFSFGLRRQGYEETQVYLPETSDLTLSSVAPSVVNSETSDFNITPPPAELTLSTTAPTGTPSDDGIHTETVLWVGDGADYGLRVEILATGQIRAIARQVDNTEVFRVTTTQQIPIDDDRYSIHISWSGTSASIKVNGVDDSNLVAGTAGNIDYTAKVTIGKSDDSAAPNRGDFDLAEVYFDDTETPEAEKFYNAALTRFVDLGSTGAAPSGSAPRVYLNQPYTAFGINQATSDDFTTEGGLDEAENFGMYFEAPVDIEVPQGDLTLSSTAPSVTEGASFNLEPPQGNLTLSSAAPSVDISYDITIPQGDLALTTVAAALGLGVQGTQGDLTLSTIAPSVDISYDIAVPQGDLTLSTAAVSQNIGVLGAAGDLTLSAEAPSVDISYDITLPQGDLVLSSAAPSVDISYGIEAPQGDLTLSTEAPTADATTGADVERTPPQGDLTLSSTAPAVDISYDIAVPQGDLALSSEGATLDLGVHGTQGDLTLSSEAPALAVTDSHDITVPQGDLTLSGQASTFHFGVALTAGDLTLSTAAPGAAAGSNRQPPAADLTLSTSAPTAITTSVLEIPAGNLVLSTAAVSLGQSFSEAQEAEPARTYVTRVRKTISQFQPRRTKKTSRVRLTRWLTTKR